ncbi:Rrf2 family transcriptional regulator [Ruminococcaceae bacterium OttesenSCG-928-D13]|nr:Rrf2 family transcriptional regulator [Ruminococcaceae bacterium OttesenSCG-928-D13]
MKISTKGRYALRMMVDLAVNDSGDYISLRDVAERQEISMKYMEQIVSLLTRGGFLYSVRGPQGGYRLARRPEEYTAGDILRVTEGSLAPLSCIVGPEHNCPRGDTCPTLEFWEGLHETITRYVDSVSLADLVAVERQKLIVKDQMT